MNMPFLFPSSNLPYVPHISNSLNYPLPIMFICFLQFAHTLVHLPNYWPFQRSQRSSSSELQLDLAIFPWNQTGLSLKVKSLSLKIASFLSHQPCMLILDLEQSRVAERAFWPKPPQLSHTKQLERGNIFSLVRILLKCYKVDSMPDKTLRTIESSPLTCKVKC